MLNSDRNCWLIHLKSEQLKHSHLFIIRHAELGRLQCTKLFKKYCPKSTYCLHNYFGFSSWKELLDSQCFPAACAHNKLSFDNPWQVTPVARRITELIRAPPFQTICRNSVPFNKLYFWMQLHHRI